MKYKFNKVSKKEKKELFFAIIISVIIIAIISVLLTNFFTNSKIFNASEDSVLYCKSIGYEGAEKSFYFGAFGSDLCKISNKGVRIEYADKYIKCWDYELKYFESSCKERVDAQIRLIEAG